MEFFKKIIFTSFVLTLTGASAAMAGGQCIANEAALFSYVDDELKLPSGNDELALDCTFIAHEPVTVDVEVRFNISQYGYACLVFSNKYNPLQHPVRFIYWSKRTPEQKFVTYYDVEDDQACVQKKNLSGAEEIIFQLEFLPFEDGTVPVKFYFL